MLVLVLVLESEGEAAVEAACRGRRRRSGWTRSLGLRGRGCDVALVLRWNLGEWELASMLELTGFRISRNKEGSWEALDVPVQLMLMCRGFSRPPHLAPLRSVSVSVGVRR